MGYQGIVTLRTELEDIIPHEHRISKFAQFEANLGLKLDVLRPPFVVEAGLTLISVFSLIGVFVEWKLFGPLFLVSIFVYQLAWKFGKKLQMKTVGDLARTMAANHYFKLRPDCKAINRNEFREILISRLNQNYLGESNWVTAESRF